MKIILQSRTNSFILNSMEYQKGFLHVNYRLPNLIVMGGITAGLSDIECDGQTFNTIEELRTWISDNLFSTGGGSGEGLQWSDASWMPVADKVVRFSPQGLVSTGTPLFPENAVPLVYLDVVLASITGWAIYNDSQYTQASPLVINEGVTTKITINGATSIKNQLPNDVSDWWNSTTNKITPSLAGDSYIVNLRFTATSSSNTGLADVEVDIGGTLNVIDGSTVSLRKGTGNTQRVSLKFDLYAASTFISNGGEIKLRSIDGNTSIYNISVKITRVHKSKSPA